MPREKAQAAHREAESTDAPGRGGLLRSSDEAGVMPAERRERAIAIWLGSTGNGKNPMFNGRRQPSCGGTSWMTRERQVRFCEGLGVKFPGPTRQTRKWRTIRGESALPESFNRANSITNHLMNRARGRSSRLALNNASDAVYHIKKKSVAFGTRA
jgi:hypothetical protein